MLQDEALQNCFELYPHCQVNKYTVKQYVIKPQVIKLVLLIAYINIQF